MKTAAMILLLALAGCAITPEKMATYSDYDVCRYTMDTAHSPIAKEEVKRRSLDCGPFYPIMAAREAAGAAAGLMLIQAGQAMTQRQPVYQAPQPINCTSQRFGTRVDTTCN